MNLICVLVRALCLGSAYRLSTADVANRTCIAASGIPGHCKPMKQCQPFIEFLKRMKQGISLTIADTTYIRNSKCPVHKKGYVCCENEQISKGMQMLIKQDCGYFGGTKKTYGGNVVKLMSRPWMALLKFKGFKDNEFICAGSLITERYVLSAAHCFKNHELLSVRLGEHQISSTEDCEMINGERKCAPPVEDIGVERIIIHQEYANDSAHNDIALVKLSRDVQFKESIRPICLPVNKTLQKEPEKMDEFLVTGWGRTENTTASDVPMETEISNKQREICQNAFQRSIRKSQLCAGSLGKDSCKGDSGGPLIYVSSYKELQRYVQFGIVSYGSTHCADGHPGVYTNVGSFIFWIAENIISN